MKKALSIVVLAFAISGCATFSNRITLHVVSEDGDPVRVDARPYPSIRKLPMYLIGRTYPSDKHGRLRIPCDPRRPFIAISGDGPFETAWVDCRNPPADGRVVLVRKKPGRNEEATHRRVAGRPYRKFGLFILAGDKIVDEPKGTVRATGNAVFGRFNKPPLTADTIVVLSGETGTIGVEATGNVVLYGEGNRMEGNKVTLYLDREDGMKNPEVRENSAPEKKTTMTIGVPIGSSGVTDNAKKSVTHKVKAGESVASIAHDYGVTVDDLIRANKLDGPKSLRIGQVLLIRERSKHE